jgi:hypothetical protein
MESVYGQQRNASVPRTVVTRTSKPELLQSRFQIFELQNRTSEGAGFRPALFVQHLFEIRSNVLNKALATIKKHLRRNSKPFISRHFEQALALASNQTFFKYVRFCTTSRLCL